MSNEQETLMLQYNITCEPKMIYSYKQHRYENLKDAINFAQLEAARTQEDSSPKATDK